MAKRSGKQSSGGGFGGKKRPGPRNMPHRPAGGGDPESERMIRAIQQALEAREFDSEEEVLEFLKSHAGKPMDEIVAALDQVPEDDLGRATSLIYEIPPDASPAEARKAAGEALEISPECLEAWLVFGDAADDPEESLRCFREGVDRGKRRLAPLIEAADEELGLWGWVEARPLLRLYRGLARAQEQTGDFDGAEATYKEMLRLNPGDNQGARLSLLRLLCISHRLVEGRELLDRYDDDVSIEMTYGRAFVAIVEAMEASDDPTPNPDKEPVARNPVALVKSLGPAFASAKKELKRALKENPYVPVLMLHPQMMQVAQPEFFTMGGPSEALCYAQEWGLLWQAAVLPFAMLAESAKPNLLRSLKNPRHAEEMGHIFAELEAQTCPPWWSLLDE